MIVLSRRKQESVVVGGSSAFGRVLKVTVLDIADGHVKLGFEANEDIPVERSEGWKRLFTGMPPAARQPPSSRTA